jgi:glycosyltransferase involved in cell wall biosynthesis
MDFRDLKLILLADWDPIQLTAMASAIGVGLLMVFFAFKSRWNYRKLPELEPVERNDDAIDKTSIVIPARDEAHNIKRVLASFRPDRVVVVDDASTDDTAKIAAAYGALVVEPPPLKKGTHGKPNACQAGAEMAPPSEYLMFVDADTWYEPGFIPSIAAQTTKDQRTMVSVFPRQECVSLAEKAILPYAFALYFCGVSAENLNDSSSPAALANGQCMFFRRSAYEFIGGHKMVLRSVIEDVELARVAKRHQLSVAVYRGEKLASVRMYDGFRSIWRGFTKNAFRFLMVNPRTGLQVVIASIVMSSWLPVLLFQIYAGAWTSAVIFGLLPSILFYPWYRSFFSALLAPIGIYAFQLIALNALFHTTFGLQTQWKGRPV